MSCYFQVGFNSVLLFIYSTVFTYSLVFIVSCKVSIFLFNSTFLNSSCLVIINIIFIVTLNINEFTIHTGTPMYLYCQWMRHKMFLSRLLFVLAILHKMSNEIIALIMCFQLYIESCEKNDFT